MGIGLTGSSAELDSDRYAVQAIPIVLTKGYLVKSVRVGQRGSK